MNIMILSILSAIPIVCYIKHVIRKNTTIKIESIENIETARNFINILPYPYKKKVDEIKENDKKIEGLLKEYEKDNSGNNIDIFTKDNKIIFYIKESKDIDNNIIENNDVNKKFSSKAFKILANDNKIHYTEKYGYVFRNYDKFEKEAIESNVGRIPLELSPYFYGLYSCKTNEGAYDAFKNCNRLFEFGNNMTDSGNINLIEYLIKKNFRFEDQLEDSPNPLYNLYKNNKYIQDYTIDYLIKTKNKNIIYFNDIAINGKLLKQILEQTDNDINSFNIFRKNNEINENMFYKIKNNNIEEVIN
jgi:hypothetical protein